MKNGKRYIISLRPDNKALDVCDFFSTRMLEAEPPVSSSQTFPEKNHRPFNRMVGIREHEISCTGQKPATAVA